MSPSPTLSRSSSTSSLPSVGLIASTQVLSAPAAVVAIRVGPATFDAATSNAAGTGLRSAFAAAVGIPMEGAFVSGAVKHATGEKILYTSNSDINTAGNTLSSAMVADALVESGGNLKSRMLGGLRMSAAAVVVSRRSLADSGGIDFLASVTPIGINDVDPTSQDITLTVVVLARLGNMTVTDAAAATSALLAHAVTQGNATNAALLPFLTAIAISSNIPLSTLRFSIAPPTPAVLTRTRTYYSYFQAWMNYIASLSGGAIAGIVLSTLSVIILIILLVKRLRGNKLNSATVAPLSATSGIDIIVKESSDSTILQQQSENPPQDTINNLNTARARNSKRIQPAADKDEGEDEDDTSERRGKKKNDGDDDDGDDDDSDTSSAHAKSLRRAAKAEKRQLRETRRELEKKEIRRAARRIARAATERSIAVTAAMASTNSAREYSVEDAAIAHAAAEEDADAHAVAQEAEAMHTQILLAARSRALALSLRGLSTGPTTTASSSTTTKITSIRSLSPKPLFLSPQGAASAAAAQLRRTTLYAPSQGYGPRPPRGLPPPASLRTAMPLSAAGQRALLAGRPRPMPPLGPRRNNDYDYLL